MSEIFKIGIPTLVFQILTSLSISFVNTKSMVYGDSVIAGMGAVTRIVSMGSLMVLDLLKVFSRLPDIVMVQRNFHRLQEAIKTSILWSTIFCVIYGLILAIFSKGIISQFTKMDLDMIRVGTQSLRYKWFFIYVVWLLYCIFFIITRSWERVSWFLFRSLSARNLFHTCNSDSSSILGNQRHYVRPANR